MCYWRFNHIYVGHLESTIDKPLDTISCICLSYIQYFDWVNIHYNCIYGNCGNVLFDMESVLNDDDTLACPLTDWGSWLQCKSLIAAITMPSSVSNCHATAIKRHSLYSFQERSLKGSSCEFVDSIVTSDLFTVAYWIITFPRFSGCSLKGIVLYQ